MIASAQSLKFSFETISSLTPGTSNTIPFFPKDFTTPEEEDYSYNWVYGVAEEGTFKPVIGIEHETGAHGLPTSWGYVETETSTATLIRTTLLQNYL